ncbi:MAG: ABC transporter substrate-binding protein [Marmoricola sp.]
MRRPLALASLFTAMAFTASACGGTASTGSGADDGRGWKQIVSDASGQTVDLWMYGGDERGNSYVDDVLAPAAKKLGVTLRRVPVADTKDALRRILAQKAAGKASGDVDLIWVNGDTFSTGRQADAWYCGWASKLPNMKYVAKGDPLVSEDFGTSVDGCESPWHKAQFTFAYDSAKVQEPPQSFDDLLTWARAHPGRFTYPAPPDFTGSVFVRQALYAASGGAANVPRQFAQGDFDQLTPALWKSLEDLNPSLWREGRTYPRDEAALNRLYADGEVDFTMTYGPATLTDLVDKGTFPATTRVLALEDGTVGNASFLGIPSTSTDRDGAMVVANLALSPEQQAAKADPAVWGQFPALDLDLLDAADRARFEELPKSEVVPSFDVLSKNAKPELSSSWVTPLDEGWRRQVLGAGS